MQFLIDIIYWLNNLSVSYINVTLSYLIVLSFTEDYCKCYLKNLQSTWITIKQITVGSPLASV